MIESQHLKGKPRLHFPAIKNNSWKAVANSRIEIVDFEKLSSLTDIDDGREGLKLKGEKLLDFIYDKLKDTSQEKKEVLMLLITDVIWTTESLQSNIEAFINNEVGS